VIHYNIKSREIRHRQLMVRRHLQGGNVVADSQVSQVGNTHDRDLLVKSRLVQRLLLDDNLE